jgi:hypothetical protein
VLIAKGTSTTFSVPSGITVSLPAKSLAVTTFPNGTIVNRAYEGITARIETQNQIPYDDTVPTSSEGAEIGTIAIITSSTTNRVRFRAIGMCQCGTAARTLIFAAFHGTTCHAVQTVFIETNNAVQPFCIEFEHVPGTAEQQTYSLRFGNDDGTTGVRVNGNTAGRLFGATQKTVLIAEEIQSA